MTKKVLLVAYHFPPLQGSSGLQRTLSFARFLPEFGWRADVLTAHERAYVKTSAESLSLVPADTNVHRAAAFDTQRHLSFSGRYLDSLAIPDRWQTWILPAIIKGSRIVRNSSIDVVCSTYPIASAHLIGYGISKLSGRPWVADLRDPMLQDTFPHGKLRRKSYGFIERLVFRHAAAVVVTTQGCVDFYVARYGEAAKAKMFLIENGYDEQVFPPVERAEQKERPITLIHSGLVYKADRNPQELFGAIRDLLDDGTIDQHSLRIIFRAPGSEVDFQSLGEEYGISEIIQTAPPVSYQEALAEMQQADGLLILQADTCNQQIPAKLYEYVYARKPILGLADPRGDTGKLLSNINIQHLAKLEDRRAIASSLAAFVRDSRDGNIQLPDDDVVMGLSRRERTREFAATLDGVVQAA